MGVRISHPKNPRFPSQRKSAKGKAGPKAMAKAAANGQSVNIPTHPHSSME